MIPIHNFDSKAFLSEFWQTKAKVVFDAFRFDQAKISGEELAGLACEEHIESRLILANDEQSVWQCEYGYFAEERFTTLEEKNWTLLVQGVDDNFEQIRELREAFDFLPKWRLDDVMMSYATPGGGVGPHFDYYDVFLIQTSGSREWKIGQRCDSNSTLRKHPDLKLLKNFQTLETHVLNPGDMLYIPAGVAHWGTAVSDDCITASVGFRAPSHRELLLGATDRIVEDFSEDQRYKDSDIPFNEDAYLINTNIKKQMFELWKNLSSDEVSEKLSDEFSCQVTVVRDSEIFEFQDYSVDELKNTLTIQLKKINKHPAARFAYRHKQSAIELYVNGQSYFTELGTAKAICHENFGNFENLDLKLITELLNTGALLLTET